MSKDASTTLEEALLETVRELPPEKQQEILDRARELRAQITGPKKPRRSAAGLWADLKIDLSEEDIKEARREMWKNFPRDFPDDKV